MKWNWNKIILEKKKIEEINLLRWQLVAADHNERPNRIQ